MEQKRFYMSKQLKGLKVECDSATMGIKGSGKRRVPHGIRMITLTGVTGGNSANNTAGCNMKPGGVCVCVCVGCKMESPYLLLFISGSESARQ